MRVVISPATAAIEVIEAPVPQIGPGELLLSLEACGICGTDLMKVYTPGVARPLQLGHEVVGLVEQAGAGASFAPGMRLAVAHHVPDFASHLTRRGSAPMDAHFKQSNIDPGGFADFVRVPAEQARHTALPVPDGMPTLRAVFMEPLACCLRALDRVSLTEGDSVLLVGSGAAGLLFAPLLRDRSVALWAADLRPERLELAREWGATHGLLVGSADIPQILRGATAGRGADCVILTVLSAQTWQLALDAVRDGGTILLFGVKPGTEIATDYWALWRREINVVTSYSSTPELLPRAMALLRRGDWALERTISHQLPLAQAAQAFPLMRDGLVSKVVITRE